MEIDDIYTHLNPEIFYITENIMCLMPKDDPEVEKIESDYNCQIEGCICDDFCIPSICTCILASNSSTDKENINSSYTKSGSNSELVLSDNYKLPIYECNSSCRCKTCQNKLVQYGPRKSLEIKECKTVGEYGLFTVKDVPKGGFICEYAGEIITKSEAIKRNDLNESNDSKNYIICVNEHVGVNRIQTFVDPSVFGNVGRYLNHSCEPNCHIIPIRVDNMIPKLCIFALDNIKKDTELTFSYGDNINESGRNNKKCWCNSKKCLGWLPFNNYDR